MQRRDFLESESLQARVSGLDRIARAIELAQIGEPAHREAVGILLAGFEQFRDVLGHLGACIRAGGGGTVEQEIVSHHDAVDGGFQFFLSG